MDLYGIGFSVIRLPNEIDSIIYTYNPMLNRFPEGVFVHEFLHTLERIMLEHEYDIPALHDYADFGYSAGLVIGSGIWYRDYMRQNIWDEVSGRYVRTISRSILPKACSGEVNL